MITMPKSKFLQFKKIVSRNYYLVLGIPFFWLILFLFIPFLIVFKISLSQLALSVPPYQSLLSFRNTILQLQIDLSNYIFIFTDIFYSSAFLNSLKIALISTFIALLIGFPVAYFIARASATMRPLLLMLIILPSWMSFLIRIYAWIGILSYNGLLNHFLMTLGWIDEPLRLLYNNFAVYLGIVYGYLPFMILPLYAHLSKMDWTLLDAASDLGAKPYKVFSRITLPLSMRGILTGSLLVFIPAVGEFVIPELMGGSDVLMIGRVLWQEFFSNRDWPLASSVAVVMIIILVIPIYFFGRKNEK